MKEIKFRAWNKEKKVLVYDNEDNTADYWDGAIASNVGMVNGILSDNDYLWMQYTGLKDKNGKEIYEGDIMELKNWQPSIVEVVFDRGGFCFRYSAADHYYNDCKYLEDGEIIGNIYENPELLSTQPSQ